MPDGDLEGLIGLKGVVETAIKLMKVNFL